jgi:voltage-gated potassium channel
VSRATPASSSAPTLRCADQASRLSAQQRSAGPRQRVHLRLGSTVWNIARGFCSRSTKSNAPRSAATAEDLVALTSSAAASRFRHDEPVQDPFRRVRIGLVTLTLVLLAGTAGYLILGFDFLDSLYQTVTTVTTVGFTSPRPLGMGSKIFTIVLILVGVGTALFTFSAVLELRIEGHMRDLVRRRKMDRNIAQMSGHVIVCGWGRVGREVARFLITARRQIVVIDRDPTRLDEVPYPTVEGDVTEDETLSQAGIERATALVACLNTDADNLYVTVAAKSIRPDLQIIARARSESSEPKLFRAGANRVVNPQQLGGDRMASFVTQPHVVDFIDVVMHDGSLEFRLAELIVSTQSFLSGSTIRAAHLRDRTGALVLAIPRPGGVFVTNPSPEDVIEAGDILISVGTADQLTALAEFAVRP